MSVWRASRSSRIARATSAPSRSDGGRNRAPSGKIAQAQQRGDRAHRQVVEHADQRFLDAEQAQLHAPAREREVRRGLRLVVIALQRRAREIEVRERVGESAGKFLAPLQRAAERSHRGVRNDRECGRESRQVLVVAMRVLHGRRIGETRSAQREHLGADRARDEKIHVTEDRLVERREVVRGDGLDFLVHERMAADRALAVDDHRARQDVRAFDRDADRHGVPRARERVARTALDRAAGADVHRVGNHLAHRVGEIGLADVAGHGGFLAGIERAAGQRARRGHQIREPGDARERLLDAFEAADRRVELLAHGGVRAADARGHLRGADAERRQRDRAPGGERFHQHAPALADAVAPADDDFVERHAHVGADDRTVLERHAHRIVAQADLDAGRVARDQRAGDAAIFLVAEQLVRIFQAEREADQRRDRRQRDVALVPVEAQADDVLAVDVARLDDAFGLRRRRVGAGFGSGQREARNLLAGGEARQVALLLLVGAVVEQQLAGPERVRHHHRDRGGDRAAGQARDHARMRERGESESAEFLRDDHAEEAFALDEVPDLGRQVAALVDVPVVEAAAEFVDGSVEKRALLRRQRRRFEVEQLLPVRHAAEEIAVPPHGAGLERDALGFAEARQHFRKTRHHEARNEMTAQRWNAEHGGKHDQRDCHELEQQRRIDADDAPADQPDAGRGDPGEKTEPAECEDEKNDEGEEERDEHGASSIGMR